MANSKATYRLRLLEIQSALKATLALADEMLNELGELAPPALRPRAECQCSDPCCKKLRETTLPPNVHDYLEGDVEEGNVFSKTFEVARLMRAAGLSLEEVAYGVLPVACGKFEKPESEVYETIKKAFRS